MKIAFCNRINWNNPLGGDGIQMLKTKESLEKLYNLQIVIITNPKDLDSSFDIIHVFNYVTYNVTRQFVEEAVALGIPLVTSSIFWDYTYAYDRVTNFFVTDKLSYIAAVLIKYITHISAKLVGKPLYFSSYFRNQLDFFMDMSKAILPNSIEEGELLLDFVGKECYREKINVVYNAADDAKSDAFLSETIFKKKYNLPDNYILQIGRIEPVKNQINLVYALRKNPDIPIVFVGKIVNKSYFKKIKKVADKRGNVFFVDFVNHDEICNFYKYASLHVLLSLRESPGLVSLEALSYGCPVVVATSKYAPVKTYFENHPYIVDPFNLRAIRQIVLRAYKEKHIHKNMEKITWDVSAEQTYKVYSNILS